MLLLHDSNTECLLENPTQVCDKLQMPCHQAAAGTALRPAWYHTVACMVQKCKYKHVCLIDVCVVQDARSVLSKAVALHGMGALPGLKPGQGRGQTDGAVSDSPIAPSSPLIAAKSPFTQVWRVTDLMHCPALAVSCHRGLICFLCLFFHSLFLMLADCASFLRSTLQNARSRRSQHIEASAWQ